MENFFIRLDETHPFPVFHIQGYFSEEAGIKLTEEATGLFRGRKVRLAIDFSECFAINSPGIAALMDLSLVATDDFKGKIILSGLNEMSTKVLSVSGVIPFIDSAPTFSEALKKLAVK